MNTTDVSEATPATPAPPPPPPSSNSLRVISSKTTILKPNVDISALTRVSEALLADTSPKEVLQLILKAAQSITRASSASLMLLEPGTDILRVEVAEGFKDKKIMKTRLRVGQGVTGWVAETGVPLRVGNVLKDPRYVRVQRDLRSELAVPLKIKGRLIGVISCDSTRINHFSPDDEALLLSLAAQSARVIFTTQLYEETRRHADDLRLLLESASVLTGTLDLNHILEQLTALAARHWKVPLAAVYLAEPDGKTLKLAAAHGGSPAFREQPAFAPENTLLGRAFIGKKAVYARDLQELQHDASLQPALKENALSLLAAPLAANKKRLGVLCVFGVKKNRFDTTQSRLLSGLASSASLAIANANAHQRMMASEEALRQTEKSSLMVELAAALAHEIRNPLTSVKLLFDTLRRAPEVAGKYDEDTHMIGKQLERLEAIVGQYLDTARTHDAAMQAQILDLNTVVDESLLLLAGSAHAHEGARMLVGLDPAELWIKADATQLSQAVYNLVLNALQAGAQHSAATGGGKRVRIDVRSGRLPPTQPGQPGRIFFEVADEGPGLSEEVKEKLFQPFVTTKKQGVGLGLSIVKRIVTAHNGQLEIESPRADIKRGARFRIVLQEAPA